MRVKIFLDSGDTLETKINKFFDEHPKIVINHVLQSEGACGHSEDFDTNVTVSIWYTI